MRSTWLLVCFALLACGKYEVDSNGGIGEIRTLNDPSHLITGLDRLNLNSICNAMAQKASILPLSVNLELTFLTKQKNCTGNPVEQTVETLIQSRGESFVLKKKSDNLDFIFPEIETNTSGVLADICGSIPTLENPVVSGQSATYVRTTGIDRADCAPTSSRELCVQVEKALQQGNTFVVHTREWLKVRVSSQTNEKVGFYTYRKKLSRGYCADRELLDFQATLLGI